MGEMEEGGWVESDRGRGGMELKEGRDGGRVDQLRKRRCG